MQVRVYYTRLLEQIGPLALSVRNWAQSYIEQLLCPQDWFSFWRLNCRLASYHALVTGSLGYRQEDKVGYGLSPPCCISQYISDYVLLENAAEVNVSSPRVHTAMVAASADSPQQAPS